MVKIEAVSATSTPLWLLASALLFLALRCGLTYYEEIYPPQSSAEVKWRTIESVSDAERSGKKLFFYDFRADWCEPCKKMESTAFLSRDCVKRLNDDFVAIRITDRKKEDGKNSELVQELEDKYSIQAFPSLIVAMPDGTKVIDHLGSANSSGLKTFLQEAATVADYYWGKEEMIAGNIDSAARAFDNFISKTKWQHWRCSYAAIFSALAHRQLGENEKADKILKDALSKLHDHLFPYPVIQYLAGQRSFDELRKDASESKNNRILSYACSGMDYFARGKFDEAKERFEWVTKNSDDKSTFEFRIARAELSKLELQDPKELIPTR